LSNWSRLGKGFITKSNPSTGALASAIAETLVSASFYTPQVKKRFA